MIVGRSGNSDEEETRRELEKADNTAIEEYLQDSQI